MDRIDSFSETLEEARDIALDNRSRLGRLEELALDNRSRLDRLEELALENRAILFAIADHLDLTYEKPNGGSQLD